MALPDLVATLTAKTDGFESALNRAAKAAQATADKVAASTEKMSSAYGFLEGAVKGLAAGLTVGAFVGLVKGAIDAADHLNDLSKKTGIAVTTLGGMGFAAEQAGSSLDSIADASVKLNKTIADAAAGGKESAASFAAVGVSVTDAAGKTKASNVIFGELADKFASYADGPEKTALAIKLFGKAGADIIPVLNEGGQALAANIAYYERFSGVTQELAEKADAFNDTLAKLSLLQGAFGKQLAAELLPTLQTLANLFLETKEKGTAMATVAEEIGAVFNRLVGFAADVAFTFDRVGNTIGGLAAQIERLAHLDFAGVANIQTEIILDDKNARQKLDRFKFDLENAKDQAKATATGGTFDQEGTSKVGVAKQQAPRVPKSNTGAAPKVDDLAKRQLDQDLKALDNFIAAERDLMNTRSEMLSLHYQADNLSIDDYFRARRASRDGELASVREAYAKEVAAIEVYIAAKQKSNDPKSEGKVIEAQTKLADVRAKLAKTESEAARENVRDVFAQKKAVEQYGDELTSLQAQVAALQGQSGKTFTLNFDVQNRSLTERIDKNLTSEDPAKRQAAEAAKEQLGFIRQQGVVTATLNDIEKQRSVVLGDLANAQSRINLAVSQGTKSEIAGLQETQEANRARLGALQKVVEAYEQVAKTSADPQAKIQAEALRIEMEKLAASTDLVVDKLANIGGDAFSKAIDSIANGTATAKDAFRTMVKDINSELLKIGAGEVKAFVVRQLKDLAGKFFPAGAEAAKSATSATDVAASAAGVAGKVADTAGAAASTAANDAAFATLAATVTTADASFVALSATTPLVDTAFATLGTSAALATAALDTMAAAAASAAASSGGSSVAGIAGAVASASAMGNVFDMGNVVPFARGGVIDRATVVPMALMGEAGPEAVMPLRRGADGRLGVAAAGGAGSGPRTVQNINNVTNVNVPAPTSRDLRSASQTGRAIARQLGR